MVQVRNIRSVVGCIIMINWFKKRKTVAVHDGNFHPDDVFSVALLSILHKGRIKVIRTRDEKKYSTADFVVDTGFEYNIDKNRFDHHQDGGAGFRENKITYSSFGILWKEYGEEICGSKKIAEILDKKLVEVVDADDCGFDLYNEIIPGVKPFLLNDFIYSMRPTWKETNLNIDKIFSKAVSFAKKVILREISVASDNIEALDLVDEVYKNSKDKRIILFQRTYLPIISLYKYPEPLFIIYKDKGGEMWRVKTIEKYEHKYECRKNFPEIWWGKKGEELIKITGVNDAVFCRNGGVFVGVKSLVGAIKLAELALKNK